MTLDEAGVREDLLGMVPELGLEGGVGQTQIGRALQMERTALAKAQDVKDEGGAGGTFSSGYQ